MYETKKCEFCGEIKIYDCEQCYGASDTEKDSIEKKSSKCLNKCSEGKKN